ncbi:magnesium transporter MRS2-I-like [Eucalyptus grandis]|uniref:magnesium transporter MRS2-I-like n=1 Tax=Eucalyptus grandis TaxID=71139 RepID=UPI00192EE08D|nr:magnesium transporter MRS2-I-like [Eucalyptus grandis]
MALLKRRVDRWMAWQQDGGEIVENRRGELQTSIEDKRMKERQEQKLLPYQGNYHCQRGFEQSGTCVKSGSPVLLRDPSDINVIPVVEELQRRLAVNAICQGQDDAEEYSHVQNDVEAGEDDESPFEFRAVEVALEAICSFLAARTTELETAAYPALDELTSKISSRNLDRVRKLKSAMTRLTSRVQKVRDELEQLLDDDDDMADLYLSRKQVGASSPISGSGAQNWFPASPTIGSKISRASRVSVATVRGDEDDVEELEMLLEAYFMQIDGTLNKLTTLREYIDDTEDYINIQLDNHRNQLIQLELFLSSGTVCLSIYSLVAGIFGVNIPYDWNTNHGYMFKWIGLNL